MVHKIWRVSQTALPHEHVCRVYTCKVYMQGVLLLAVIALYFCEPADNVAVQQLAMTSYNHVGAMANHKMLLA